MALGVGDALASSIGKKYGSIKWPGLSKSIQGTAAFIFGLFFANVITAKIFNEDFSVGKVFISCFWTGND